MSGAHVAIAAHIAAKKKQEEEEKMGYNLEELENDWEFKILRSATSQFKNYEVVEKVKAEESVSGWVMVEKFDNNRIRFKRPRKAMENDIHLPPGVDPYRIDYGMSEGMLGVTITGVILAAIGIFIAVGVITGFM